MYSLFLTHAFAALVNMSAQSLLLSDFIVRPQKCVSHFNICLPVYSASVCVCVSVDPETWHVTTPSLLFIISLCDHKKH